MRVLVACEMSGVVREAFKARGHYALSCDLLPSLIPGEHRQGDVLDVLGDGWDLMVAFPPCTDLAVSGSRWFAEKRADGRQQRAIEFARTLLDAPIARVALENPVGVLSRYIRKPDQTIEPYWFGDPVKKITCIWLRGLPELEPTDIVPDALVLTRRRDWYDRHTGEDRRRHRAMTFPGIARAMAEQWG